ncbi:MAG: hypothetical protein HXX20_01775 [Chloroflexi bacterium]|nr:hypothetical protein [Chloroflexota bacterium]
MWRKIGSLALCGAILISIFPALMGLKTAADFEIPSFSQPTGGMSWSVPNAAEKELGFSGDVATAGFFTSSSETRSYFSTTQVSHNGSEEGTADLPFPEDPLADEYNSNHLSKWPSLVLNSGNRVGLIWNGNGYVQETVFFGKLLYLPGGTATKTYLVWTVTTGVSSKVLQYFGEGQLHQNDPLPLSTALTSIPEVNFLNISEDSSMVAWATALGTAKLYPSPTQESDASKRTSTFKAVTSYNADLKSWERHELCNSKQGYPCILAANKSPDTAGFPIATVIMAPLISDYVVVTV